MSNLKREGERVSNPFSLPLTLPLSANCLTLFCFLSIAFLSFFLSFFIYLSSLFLFSSLFLLYLIFMIIRDIRFFAGARLRARLRSNNGFNAT